MNQYENMADALRKATVDTAIKDIELVEGDMLTGTVILEGFTGEAKHWAWEIRFEDEEFFERNPDTWTANVVRQISKAAKKVKPHDA